jgi:AraC family transcriptional regulator
MRITVLKNQKPSPTGFELTFSTRDSPWAGFPIEEHMSPIEGSEQRWGYPKTHVVLNLEGTCEFEYRSGTHREHVTLARNTVSVLPQGFEMTFSWKGILRFMVVEIDPLLASELVPSRHRHMMDELTPQIILTELPLVSLMRSIEIETKSGSTSGRLYGESLSLALLAYVENRFSSRVHDSEWKQVDARLSTSQKSSLLEYLHSNCQRDLSLGELAFHVDLSPSHFCRVFRNSFGETAHQYVTRIRASKARQMLSDRQLPIVEIAERVGFSSQSHMTTAFKKFYATTPHQYRQRC